MTPCLPRDFQALICVRYYCLFGSANTIKIFISFSFSVSFIFHLMLKKIHASQKVAPPLMSVCQLLPHLWFNGFNI